jgi:FAD/FMN-containing dehydrogenase
VSTSAIIASGILPAALEMMDGAAVRLVESSVYAAGYPTDCAGVLLVDLDGVEDGLEDDVIAVAGICRANGARSVRIAKDAAERAVLWQGRKKAFGAMGRVASHLVLQDAVVPRTRLPAVLQQIEAIGERHGVAVWNIFHAGDGNLHPSVSYDGTNAEESARVHACMTEIMHACIAEGGTITGEHGVGLDKIDYMPALFDGDTLAAMCRLRDVFDPDHRSNRGKVVPVHACREWHQTAAARPAHSQHA